MKKLFTLAVVALVSLGASAQLISSNMVGAKEKTGYSRLGLSYSSISSGEKGADALSGVSLDWTKGISISSSMPLFIETGIGATYGWDSETYKDEKTTTSYLGLKVPVNVTYKLDLGDSGFKVAPFAGLYFKGNILGEVTYEDDYYSYSANFYSEDDMGDEAATRFNFGIDFGVNVEYSKFFLGINYGTDFNKFFGYKGAGSMGIFSATIGFVF